MMSTLRRTYYFVAFIQILFTICTRVHAGENNYNDVVKWVAYKFGGDAIMSRAIPAGRERGLDTFLCRGWLNNNRWRIGYLWFNSYTGTCSISYGGKQYFAEFFEMLDHRPGALSWIPLPSQFDSWAIGGGQAGDGTNIYACRVLHGQNIYVGNMDKRDRVCYIGYGFQELGFGTNIEILVINHFGKYNRPQ